MKTIHFLLTGVLMNKSKKMELENWPISSCLALTKLFPFPILQ